jgi:hypothetical protein
VVEAIQALRGVELTGAIILMAELGDIITTLAPKSEAGAATDTCTVVPNPRISA